MKTLSSSRSHLPRRVPALLVAACLLGMAAVAGGTEPQSPASDMPQGASPATVASRAAAPPDEVSATTPAAERETKPKPRVPDDAKKGLVTDIEQRTTANTDFRHVLYTGEHLQLVLMSLRPGEDIGEEVHPEIDQFFRVEQGRGEVVINGVRHPIEDDDSVVVPAGARHNVVNTGDKALKLYTVYGPPEHRDGVVRATKAEAMARDDHFDGATTE